MRTQCTKLATKQDAFDTRVRSLLEYQKKLKYQKAKLREYGYNVPKNYACLWNAAMLKAWEREYLESDEDEV